MAANYPSVIPMIAYKNGVAALEWLSRAFGFRERMRMVAPDGRLAHGEMDAGEGVIMLATPSPYYRGPRRHAEDCVQSRRWLDVPFVVDGVLTYVSDLDSHYTTAKSAGAFISVSHETTDMVVRIAEDFGAIAGCSCSAVRDRAGIIGMFTLEQINAAHARLGSAKTLVELRPGAQGAWISTHPTASILALNRSGARNRTHDDNLREHSQTSKPRGEPCKA